MRVTTRITHASLVPRPLLPPHRGSITRSRSRWVSREPVEAHAEGIARTPMRAGVSMRGSEIARIGGRNRTSRAPRGRLLHSHVSSFTTLSPPSRRFIPMTRR